MKNSDLKSIFSEFDSKNKGEKYNVSKFIRFLEDKNYPINEFYIKLFEEVSSKLEKIGGDIKSEDFILNYKEDVLLNRIIELISEINLPSYQCENNSDMEDKIKSVFDMIFNIIVKVGNKKGSLGKSKDKQKYLNLLDKFMKQIMKIFQVLYSKEAKTIENFMLNMNWTEVLIKDSFSRNLSYDMLEIAISNQNKIEEKENMEVLVNYKGSLKLINDIITYLINELNINNIKEIIKEIKIIINIYKENLIIIKDIILNFLKKTFDLYNSGKERENKAEYEDFLEFLFNDIVFKENSKKKYNNKFMEILYDLYNYLVEKNNKPMIDLFLIKLFFSISSPISSNKSTKPSIRYEWLLKETNYKNIILNSLPIIFNESVFMFYSAALMNLMNPKQKGFVIEEDFIIFFENFEKYINNKNYKKEYLINFFTKKICDLMKYNNHVTKTVLQKCNIFNIIMKLIDNEKENTIKIKLIELIKEMIAWNKENYEYSFEIKIKKDMNDDINYRINILSVGYEFYNDKYNNKIGELITFMEEYSKNNKILEFIQIVEFIFKIFSEYQFKKINDLSTENISNLNNLLIQLSSMLNNPEENDFKIAENALIEFNKKFLVLIFKFIVKFNYKLFQYKSLNKEQKYDLYYTQRIIKKKTLKDIIKNLILSHNDVIKKNTLEYLLFISIDEKNNLIVSSYFLYIIIKIYYQEKDYKNILTIMNLLLNLIKKFEINAQILLHYDFLTIMLNILEELYGKENEYEEYYNSTYAFVEEISKYLNQNLLTKYLNKCFCLFKKNVLNQIKENESLETLQNDQGEKDKCLSLFDQPDNNDEDGNIDDKLANEENDEFNNYLNEDEGEKQRKNIANMEGGDNIEILEDEKNDKISYNKLCFNLLELLKKNFEENYEKKNYLIISNHTFPNHLINNILFFHNFRFKETDHYVGFKIILKINSFKGINGFTLLQLIRHEHNINISFVINNNTLEIKENSKDILYEIKNFDKIYTEGIYHNIIINFNTEEKTFEMKIDEKLIIKKSNPYNRFKFDNFNALIGFNKNFVNYGDNYIDNKLSNLDLNSNKKSNSESGDACFIYVSYLLILNTLIDDDKISLILNKEKSQSLNHNCLNHLYRTDQRNIGKNVITEVDFQSTNMTVTISEEINNKTEELKFFLYSSTNYFLNRYISRKKNINNFNSNTPNTYMYLISRNCNINEFCSLNGIWELENINKSHISSILFENYNIKINLILPYVLDFLFGFFFLIERRFNELKTNKKETEEQNETNNGEIDLSKENEDILLEHIFEILDIILLFPEHVLREYFSENNILKLKFLLYNNIFLFQFNEITVKSILEKFSKNKILFLILFSDILFDINIFAKLDSTVKNIIIEYLFKFLEKFEITKDNNEILNCINKLVASCLNIIVFIELSSSESSLGVLLNCIKNLILKIMSLKLDKKEKILGNLGKIFYEINHITNSFERYIESHMNQKIYEEYNYIFSDQSEDFIENEGYIKKLSNQINIYSHSLGRDKNVSSLISDYINENKNKKKEDCPFCAFLKKLFYEKSKFIYEEYNYIKLYNQFFRNYYQNFGDNPDIFHKNYYAWFISLKESRSKIQNKFFLKENLIKEFTYQNPNTKGKKTSYFQYMLDEDKYKAKFKELNKIFFYDKMCVHDLIIKGFNPELEIEKDNYYTCLIINKLRKILSTFILYKDRIVIYYYICLDNNNKIHIVKNGKVPQFLWSESLNSFKTEMSKYLKEKEKEIKDDYYTNNQTQKDTKPNLSNFNYTINNKFSRKIIHLNKINEIHKREYLQFPNSLEIFLDNGESYFIVFNLDIREKIFESIISSIDNISKSKQENKIPIFKSQKIQSISNKENKEYKETKENKENKENQSLFYMKHTPLSFLSQSETEHFLKNYNINIKKNSNIKSNIKAILDLNSFRDDICHLWLKNKISNYDYLLLLNTLSGRTLNDLSQYFIFPWIIKDFNKDILNWMSSSIYRDLSLPIHACGKDIEKLKEKYEELDEEKYHSGTFYSTHNFVCYYLVRLHPFVEIHLEIQGARFDAHERMFNGVKQLSEISEKLQELIPQLYYFPELYVKLNYTLEDITQDNKIINDFTLPSWSKDDPRKFTLILRKLLEGEKVSKNLNHWIDLVFGYQQRGPNAEKVLNTYRECVYPLKQTDLESMKESEGELSNYLYEKEELGCLGKQLFTGKHKSKENFNETNKSKKIFFNNNEKLQQLTITKIKDVSLQLNFQKCNDIIFPDNYSLNNIKKKLNYQGGISSLPNIINYSEEKNYELKKDKLIKNFKQDENYFVLRENYYFSSKFGLFLTFSNKFIEIINLKEKESKFYLLMDNAEISCLTLNSNGSKIYVGFSNGFVNQYKIMNSPLNNENLDNTIIQKLFQNQLEDESKVYKDIFINKIDYYKKEEKMNPNINLKLISQNNFNDNNPHVYKKINLLGLNESHNILIALDQDNIIYILSLNNNLKLMHKITFLTKYQIKMKEIIPLQENGDFIIYSSYSVDLFSINGVPLCSLNLLDKETEKLSTITCCKAVFIYDVILFTAHKDGSIIIWKIINKYIDKDNPFLDEYKYAYNYRNYMNSGIKLKKVELKRKFEKIVTNNLVQEKKNKKEKKNSYITFMKMSNDLDFMILLDNNNNIYIMTNLVDKYKKRKTSIINIMISKPKCVNCGKELIDEGIRPSNVQSLDLMEYNSARHLSVTVRQKPNNKNVICEECEQKLRNIENFLYTY